MALNFGGDGFLPPGDHALSLSELRKSVLVVGGAGCGEGWDAQWRLHLVDQLELLCGHLDRVGISAIFADGSFVTDKPRPGDIDGYFDCDLGEFHSNQLPRLVALDDAWDLRRRAPDQYGKPKPLMWHRYRVELFPNYMPPFESLATAALNPQGIPVLVPEFFRRARDGRERGIVRIDWNRRR